VGERPQNLYKYRSGFVFVLFTNALLGGALSLAGGEYLGDQFFKGIAKATPIFELLNVEKILQEVHR
jgi:hypothetical protein